VHIVLSVVICWVPACQLSLCVLIGADASTERLVDKEKQETLLMENMMIMDSESSGFAAC